MWEEGKGRYKGEEGRGAGESKRGETRKRKGEEGSENVMERKR